MGDLTTTYIIQAYEDPFQREPVLEVRRKGYESAVLCARKLAAAMFCVDVWRVSDRGTAIACLVSERDGILSF